LNSELEKWILPVGTPGGVPKRKAAGNAFPAAEGEAKKL
jgi:hypothetical protein